MVRALLYFVVLVIICNCLNVATLMKNRKHLYELAETLLMDLRASNLVLKVLQCVDGVRIDPSVKIDC